MMRTGASRGIEALESACIANQGRIDLGFRRGNSPDNLAHSARSGDAQTGSTNLSGVCPVHAADLCGRVTAMWLRIRRW